MSISGLFSTSVSGMNAQSNKLSTVGENIANANTTGYKRRGTEFSSLIIQGGGGTYNSGAVETQIRTEISRAGSVTATSSASDLAVQGNGMFVVQDQAGREFFTRAGSFVQRTDPNTGVTHLVNAAGYKLVGTVGAGGARQPIELPVGGIVGAEPSTIGRLEAQLPEDAEVGDAFTQSFTVYDANGTEETVTVTMTRNPDGEYDTDADGTADSGELQNWDIVFSSADGTETRTMRMFFDAEGQAVGQIEDPDGAAPTTHFAATDPATAPGFAAGSTLTLSDGTAIGLEFSAITQYDREFSARGAGDGRPAGTFESFRFGDDGTIQGVLDNGATEIVGTVALAKFQSPDQLEPGTGNVFSATRDSGAPQFGIPGENGLGMLQSGALEQSNVDLATELTSMIEAQRSYSANSKTFQTADEVMQTLVNLKR